VSEPDGERLQKVLARAGIGSRRVSEDLIADGRVFVNGTVAHLGQRVDPDVDEVTVNGEAIGVAQGLVYYLLNKPAGLVTTASDPEGRPTVVGLVPDEPRVFPVGRLDIATEGLLILTNDGALAQRLTHPSHGVEKEYLAELVADPTPLALRQLREGVEIEPGVTSAPARVSRRDPGVIRIVIHEGRNRQVRRMCEVVGFPVSRLMRVRIGPITDTHLKPGEFRPLTLAEVRALGRASAPLESGRRAGRVGRDGAKTAGNPRGNDPRQRQCRAG
jgi:23S rRNA pseudouridine2605 synthase